MEEVSFDNMFRELEKVISSNLSGTLVILVNSVAIYTTSNGYGKSVVDRNRHNLRLWIKMWSRWLFLCYKTVGAELKKFHPIQVYVIKEVLYTPSLIKCEGRFELVGVGDSFQPEQWVEECCHVAFDTWSEQWWYRWFLVVEWEEEYLIPPKEGSLLPSHGRSCP